MVFKIKIETTAEAQQLNQIATRFPFDIQVESKNGWADVKSLLGTMLLTMEDDLKLVVPDDADYRSFAAKIDAYIIK